MFKIEQNIKYPIALLLSTERRKTCEALGRGMQISGDTVSRWLDSKAASLTEFVALAKEMFKKREICLLIDETLIKKIYSQYIEGTSDHYSPSERQKQRSICAVVAMLTDGDTAIPIDLSIWTSREMDPENYRTKVTAAQEIIKRVIALINVKAVIMDGLYATQNMMRWLIKKEISFEMRFHSNRVIMINGKKYKIKECPLLKLKGYQTERTIRAFWYEFDLYFTAIKYLTKNGTVIVYQASNFKAPVRQHKALYKYRWNIEKFFRTAKQYLGLNDCQSLKKEKQYNHILNVYLAYIIAQYERIKHKLKNVETALKSIKMHNSFIPDYAISRFRGIFGHA